MKKLAFALFSLLLVFPALAQVVVNDANAEVRAVGSFHSIRINGAFNVIISQGNEEALAVSGGSKEETAKIITVVDKGVLKISFNQKDKWWPKKRKLRAYISVKNINEIIGSGASEIEIEGSLSSENLRLNLSGATDFKGKIFVSEKLNIELSGASHMAISGTATDTRLNASGASKMKSYDFSSNTCQAKASGASSLQLTVEKELTAQLSGASNLRYAGNAVIRDIKTSGASSVVRRS